MFRGRVRHVHFVGVGGIGMSGLAEILRTMEFDVSGSAVSLAPPSWQDKLVHTVMVCLPIGLRLYIW